ATSASRTKRLVDAISQAHFEQLAAEREAAVMAAMTPEAYRAIAQADRRHLQRRLRCRRLASSATWRRAPDREGGGRWRAAKGRGGPEPGTLSRDAHWRSRSGCHALFHSGSGDWAAVLPAMSARLRSLSASRETNLTNEE